MNSNYTLAVRAVLSALFVTGYGLAVWLVLQPGAEFSASAEKLATFVLGALTTCVVGVFNYWFSSSQGSSEKTAALASALSK